MGGWRKLWFVLQNQLLLSYSSKDDYEKKLAPFKDVVSLVPGTTIRPTKGPRFIIETTTNLMLTYVSIHFMLVCILVNKNFFSNISYSLYIFTNGRGACIVSAFLFYSKNYYILKLHII